MTDAEFFADMDADAKFQADEDALYNSPEYQQMLAEYEAKEMIYQQARAEEEAHEAWQRWRADKLDDDPDHPQDELTFEVWCDEMVALAEQRADEAYYGL